MPLAREDVASRLVDRILTYAAHPLWFLNLLKTLGSTVLVFLNGKSVGVQIVVQRVGCNAHYLNTDIHFDYECRHLVNICKVHI